MLLKSLLFILLVFPAAVHAEKLSSGEDSEVFVAERIAQSDVTVFAKSYCPHSHKTRYLIQSIYEKEDISFTFDYLEIDLMGEDGPVIQGELLRLSGQRTVPNIFIGGAHIGGNSDLQQIEIPVIEDMILSSVSRRDLKEYL